MLNPPPNVYAAEKDWNKIVTKLAYWWQMGQKQQEPLISEYANLSYAHKMMYQANISWLMEFQYCTFLQLSNQPGKLRELQNRVNQVSLLPPSNSRRISNQNSITGRRISIDETATSATESIDETDMSAVESIDETDTSAKEIMQSGNSNDSDEDMDAEMEAEESATGHSDGYFLPLNGNGSTKESSGKCKSKHIASALVLRKLNALLEAHVNFTEASPLGDEQLDNINDILLVHMRNVAWTGKEGGITQIRTLPNKKWIVAIFGRSQLHAKRLFVHLVKAHASNDNPDIFPGNYKFRFVCGDGTCSLKESVAAYKDEIEQERVDAS